MTSSEDDAFVEDFLAHHGVRGMKWGVRRSRGGYMGKASAAKAASKGSDVKLVKKDVHPSGQVTWHVKEKNAVNGILVKAKTNRDGGKEVEAKVKEAASAHIEKMKAAAAPKPKADPIKVMTNEELENAIKRIQMEKQYKQLVQEMNAPATPKKQKLEKQAKEAISQALVRGGSQAIQNTTATVAQHVLDQQMKKFVPGYKGAPIQPKKKD